MIGKLLSLALAVTALLAQAPPLTLEQKEAFLLKAKVVSTKGAKKGITGTIRATLSDGTITHDASIQHIDAEKPRFESAAGTEINFRDSYKFNIAAYRLGRMLGLDAMIPPSVERSFQGATSAFTWWVEDIQMDEVERLKKKAQFPDKDNWARQYLVMKVFDQLIFNTDRNAQNMLYDKDWHLWMIDHSRAFRISPALQNPKALERCDRALLAKIKALDGQNLKKELGDYLRPMEIKGILARRDKIVAFFEKAGDGRLYDQLAKQ